MTVVDAHMHLWKVTEHPWYPGLRQMAEQLGLDTLYRDFLPGDYRTAAAGLEVSKFVHVTAVTEPRTYLAETRWVQDTADAHDLDLVMVGTVDPALPDRDIVADLEEQAAHPRFRGARVLYGLEPDTSAARTLLGWLEGHGHAFDLVIQPPAMDAWLRTLEAYPNLTVVLEHTGWPASADEAGHAAWLSAMTQFAERTNYVCKLTGLGMTTLDLSATALRPWIEQAIELLGWDRVAFGSNMPIETMAGTYEQWTRTLEEIIGGASPDEKQRFYAANAERVYRF